MTFITDTFPKLAVTVVGFAGPEGKVAGAVLGEIFSFLMPANTGPSTAQIVLMAVHELEKFIANQLDDVEIRNATAKLKTTYDWFKSNFDLAKIDKDTVTRSSDRVMNDVYAALGPNSTLDEGINLLADPHFRCLGINPLCFGIGLKMTMRKIVIHATNDRSRIPGMIEEINGYVDTIRLAKFDTDKYIFEHTKDVPQWDAPRWRKRRDALVQKLFQGDASVPDTAMASLRHSAMMYQLWSDR
jgi:hypothetical protein